MATNFSPTMSDAKDLSHLLSLEAKTRQNSPLKNAFRFFGQEGMTFLGGGLPLPSYFPFDKITADIPSPSFPGGISAPITEDNKTVVEVYKNKAQNDPKNKDIELARSLQYGYTEGHTELLDFLREHTKTIHDPKYANWDIITSIGNTEAWDLVLRTFCTRGDSVLVEEYSFSSALETASAQGVNTIPCPMDDYGLIPEAMEKMLAAWVGPKPKFLYLICTGQNPTGSCLSAERRKAIYAIAQKYDFLVIEDEPYYFLQMETYTSDESARQGKQVHSHEEFIKAMVPSFLLMDVDGRVLRLDSFSKVLAPGLRLGWIVGQKPLLERFVRLHEVSIQCPAGFTQSLTNGLLQRWNQLGYLDWLVALRAEYTKKRDVAIDAVAKFLPSEVTTYVPPVAGMFFTVNFDATKHPKYAEWGNNAAQVEEAIYEQAIKQGCLMIPGSWFKSQGQSNPPQKALPTGDDTKVFFRGTYAAVPLDQLVLGLEKFGKAVKIEFGL